MKFLMAILAIIAYFCLEKAYLCCIKLKNQGNSRDLKHKIMLSIGNVFLAIVCIGLIFLLIFSNEGKSSKWDKLTDEEKEWYERNYGDGKLEKINKAIEDYKK